MKSYVACMLFSLLLLGPQASATDKSSEIASAIADATSVTLYSIEPVGAPRDGAGQCASACFRGWTLLGKTQLTDKGKALVQGELKKWLAAPEPEAVAMCFNPRHGVRVTTPQHTYDFVVCFECDHAEVYIDSATVQVADIYRSADPRAWDALLKTAGVRLATSADEDGI